MIEAVTLVLTGHEDYSDAGRAANPHVPWLGPWFVLFTPVVAGLAYGPLVQRFAREARGHGVPEVMFAVARQGGRIAPKVALVKSVASALCIGGGGSVGREGPIVQIGAALGSTLGGWVRCGAAHLRLLVACGAAGGIAATFNAPLAGLFFAMELILRDFTVRSFGLVAMASVTASVAGRSVLGDRPFLDLPPLTVDHVFAYGLFLLLGAIAGAVGVLFTKVLYLVEDACDAVWRGPEWLRPAVGGLLLGGVLLALPQMYGVGYPVLQEGVEGGYAIGFLLVLLAGKMFACSLTIGIGGSGGVFAPSLFIGGMLGSAYGQAWHHASAAVVGSPTVYAVIAMAAVFAGSARAPITAVLIVFELTGEYGVILPLMTAVAVATGVSRLLSRDTVYTAKLRRRGVDLERTDPGGRPVAEVMEPAPAGLPAGTPLVEAVAALTAARRPGLPLADGTGAYCGVVGALAATTALGSGTGPLEPVSQAASFPPVLTADEPLSRGLALLSGAAGADTGGLPVLDPGRIRVVGWLSERAALRALTEGPAGDGSPPVPE
ncbi:chloride channel protein [Streptomyces bambusae]|uniref:chloride channel protein n=1 Tax=Streptomyces bambusae TaxID=1550616 RepID=UPI001CFCB59A|nr:chloride channel protein [Streptomyces bambusae]MCB5165853.1 chloride channel protein [Streptomyces bambusae]